MYMKTYDKCIIAGDFNPEVSKPVINDFMGTYGLSPLIHEKTCFKSLDNPSCIDFFLTNSHNSFKNYAVISAGLSDFHKMIVTVMKTTIIKGKPKQITYRDYKYFDDHIFKEDLSRRLNAEIKNKTNFQKFQETVLEVLEKHVPLKSKLVRANEVPYTTKALRKDIKTRSRLQGIIN